MFTILCIADSDKHFSSAIEEYCKRLGKDLKIENLKPFKDDNHHLVIQKETKSLIEVLSKKYSSAQKNPDDQRMRKTRYDSAFSKS